MADEVRGESSNAAGHTCTARQHKHATDVISCHAQHGTPHRSHSNVLQLIFFLQRQPQETRIFDQNSVLCTALGSQACIHAVPCVHAICHCMIACLTAQRSSQHIVLTMLDYLHNTLLRMASRTA